MANRRLQALKKLLNTKVQTVFIVDEGAPSADETHDPVDQYRQQEQEDYHTPQLRNIQSETPLRDIPNEVIDSINDLEGALVHQRKQWYEEFQDLMDEKKFLFDADILERFAGETHALVDYLIQNNAAPDDTDINDVLTKIKTLDDKIYDTHIKLEKPLEDINETFNSRKKASVDEAYAALEQLSMTLYDAADLYENIIPLDGISYQADSTAEQFHNEQALQPIVDQATQNWQLIATDTAKQLGVIDKTHRKNTGPDRAR